MLIVIKYRLYVKVGCTGGGGGTTGIQVCKHQNGPKFVKAGGNRSKCVIDFAQLSLAFTDFGSLPPANIQMWLCSVRLFLHAGR